MVLIPLPPPPREPSPVFLTMKTGSHLIRIFNPESHGAGPLTFRHNGPRARFDHHCAPASDPSDDKNRGILYAASTLSSCVVEVFGDEGAISTTDWYAAFLTLKRPLKLVEIRDNGAMCAGTVAAIGSVIDRVITQKWSRYFYESTQFQQTDGLIYTNAHNGESAVALYERAEDGLRCDSSDVMALNSDLLRADIIRIAIDCNLIGPID